MVIFGLSDAGTVPGVLVNLSLTSNFLPFGLRPRPAGSSYSPCYNHALQSYQSSITDQHPGEMMLRGGLAKRPHCSRRWDDRRLLSSVVIVGGGPVGLSASVLLSKLGVRNVLLERDTVPTRHPQAHYINNRSMEIFRQMDDVAARISHSSPDLSEWRRFLYCTSCSTGPILGDVDHFIDEPSEPVSPIDVKHFSQNRLVPLLIEAASRYESSELRFGQAVRSLQQDDDGVTIGLVATEDGKTSELRCEYVIAADGAASTVRELCNIAMLGKSNLQHLVNVHFTHPTAWEVLQHRPAMLYFVFRPEVISVVVNHNLRRGEFVMQIPFFPPQQSLTDFTPAVVADLIRHSLGDAIEPHKAEVHSVRAWTMHAQVRLLLKKHT